ncbi:tryptophan halogenase family protein [Brevundimonas nasdae]|uniref:tryptophan halogenase family protein n=1 Tax=Brevundimonas nasdae TaxID=172043 RepID=UPI00289AD317|nr:tryptophan halogenase family protein [Brevundimonas nasdae]
MDPSRRPLKKICIVGGGSAGWIAAAALSHQFRGRMAEIELVESDDIGIVGVGESTIPPFLQMLARLGINEQDFLKEVQGSFKLGILFKDWKLKGEDYIHPFGRFSEIIGGEDFYQVWLRARAEGYGGELQDFVPASGMIRNDRFMLPFKVPRTPIADASYAVHIDARKMARYLRRFAEARGVVRTEGMVDRVAQRPDGFVEAVVLKDGRRIEADFFIDCTGFRALLISKTLGVGYHDWSPWLLCNRAVALQVTNPTPPGPYTLAHAQDAGWCWRIPLQQRSGVGYVFCDRYCSDDEALATLLKQADGEPVVDPWIIPFKTGMREKLWDKNVLSLGLAGGFIEPLESTALHLIYRGMDLFLRFLPDADCDPNLITEYNRRMTEDYEEIRDFVIMHYAMTQRDDNAFWREIRAMKMPESLSSKIELFKVNGTVREGVDLMFRNLAWQSVLEGMGVRPRVYHPLTDRVPFEGVPHHLDQAASAVVRAIQALPTHGDFLRDHCTAPSPEWLAPV